MAQMLDYVEDLIGTVGPRLAGTEKEYQASEFIANRFEQQGLTAQIEEFDCHPFAPWVSPVAYALVVFATMFTFFIPGGMIGGIVLATLGLLLEGLELFDINPLHRLLPTKLSQNVVARYEPAGSISAERPRRIIVMAHYDSGRSLIQASPLLSRYMKALKMLLRAAMLLVLVLSAVLLLPMLPELAIPIIRYILLGSGLVVVIAMFGSLINQFRPPLAGANCNAASIAVLQQIAETLSTYGSQSSRAASSSQSRQRSRRPRPITCSR